MRYLKSLEDSLMSLFVLAATIFTLVALWVSFTATTLVFFTFYAKLPMNVLTIAFGVMLVVAAAYWTLKLSNSIFAWRANRSKDESLLNAQEDGQLA